MTPSPRSPQPGSYSSSSPSSVGLRRRASEAVRSSSRSASNGAGPLEDTFLVSCLHNFRPTDPDQLPFRKGDVLQIVRIDQESGWWAARYLTDSKVGWIPRDFVRGIPRDLDRKDVLEGLRSAGVDVSDVLDAPVTPSSSSLGSLASLPATATVAEGEIVFKTALSPTNIVSAREHPASITPVATHPVRSAARPALPRKGQSEDDMLHALPMVVSAESTPVPIPTQKTGKKGKSPLKLNTNLAVQSAPSPRLSPLSLADALEFSPNTFADFSFKLSCSEGSSTGGPRTPPPPHPFASSSDWAARIDAVPRSALTRSSRSSPTPSTSSTPPPSPPAIQSPAITKPPANRARSSTVADPLTTAMNGASVRPYTGGMSSGNFASSMVGRARSKSALGMAPQTAGRSRPLRQLMGDAPDMLKRVSSRPLSPRTSAPDLQLAMASSLPPRLSPLGESSRHSPARARRGSEKIYQLTGEADACAFVSSVPARMSILAEEEPLPGPSRLRGGSDKIMQLTGDPQARAIVDARDRMRNLPWYLRPAALEGRDIQTDVDGHVKAGNLAALLEWLVSDPLVEGQDKAYRDVFLKTFTSFTTSEAVFASLQQQYNMTPPSFLDESQLQRWDEQRGQVQLRVLEALRSWLEDHHMLQEDAPMAACMQEFLSQIRSPPQAAAAARQILLSMERLQSSPGDTVPVAPTFPTASRRRGKQQQPVNNILNIDAMALAQQLTVHEALLYSRVRPQELLRYIKDQKGPGTVHLRAFCGTSDKLAALVKSSVLELEALDKRVDALEFWIKVANKCLSINNISSMSAIVAALSSADVTHLARTWNDVTSSSTKLLQQMQKYNDPNSNYSNCRQLLQGVDGPCVPFIAMYLRDILHVHEGLPDKLVTLLSPQSATAPRPPASDALAATNTGSSIVNFSKRYQLARAIDTVLRHQRHPYAFAEDPVTMGFLQERMALAAAMDKELFWTRSQAIRRAEAAYGDIKRQMEWAGF